MFSVSKSILLFASKCEDLVIMDIDSSVLTAQQSSTISSAFSSLSTSLSASAASAASAAVGTPASGSLTSTQRRNAEISTLVYHIEKELAVSEIRRQFPELTQTSLDVLRKAWAGVNALSNDLISTESLSALHCTCSQY